MIPAACHRCSAVFERRGSRAQFCPACQPAVVAERHARWVAAHPERRREQARRYNATHPETLRAGYERRRREQLDRQREKGRNAAARRLARLKAVSSVPFSDDQLRARLAFYGNRCWMCGAPGSVVDHVKPLAKGGAHILANLRPACQACNSRKQAKWPFAAVAA
jgi:5-methylcytosine-specific restriction endonuclease McrA